MGKTRKHRPEQYEASENLETPVMAPANIDLVVQEVVVAPEVVTPVAAPAKKIPYTDTGVCPLCGERKHPYQLVGTQCFRRFSDTAKVSLMKGKYLSMNEWFKQVTPLALEAAKKEYKETSEAYTKVRDEIIMKALELIKEASAGHYIQQHIFQAARQEKQQEIWGKMGGNKAFAEMKMAERAFKMLEGIVNGTVDATPPARPKEETKPNEVPTETPKTQTAAN